MKTVVATAFAALVASTILSAPIVAQQPGAGPGNPPAAAPGPGPGFGWGPGTMMGPGMMGWRGANGMAAMCDPRAAGLAEWRMDRIERMIQPNEKQRAALVALREASTKAAQTIAAACPREFPASGSTRMELMEKRLEAMLTAIKTVRPAFDAFYATLDDAQTARVDARGPRRWGWGSWRRDF
jgi:hypothetical protein